MPPTQNTLDPAMFSSLSLISRGGGRWVGLIFRKVNRGENCLALFLFKTCHAP